MKIRVAGVIGLAVLGMIPSVASAADVPAGAPVYTRAPEIVVVAYDWSGFYMGINGGGAISRILPGSSVSKRRATGLVSKAAMPACNFPVKPTKPRSTALACLPAKSAMLGTARYSTRRVASRSRTTTTLRSRRCPRSSGPILPAKPAGVLRLAPASNTPSLRIGRSALNTITSSWATGT
jgi:hypothetical protein